MLCSRKKLNTKTSIKILDYYLFFIRVIIILCAFDCTSPNVNYLLQINFVYYINGIRVTYDAVHSGKTLIGSYLVVTAASN